jgi:hypothetical protein
VVIVVIAANLMVAVATLRRAARLIVAAAGWCHGGHGAFDDLVELAAVEPYAPAFRAVVDLYALAVGHYQIDGTSRTLHARISLLAIRM